MGVKPEMVDGAGDDRTANNGVRHQYRKLNEAEKAAMVALKDCGAEFLTELAHVEEQLGGSRELSLAKTKVEEAVMWAVKSVTK